MEVPWTYEKAASTIDKLDDISSILEIGCGIGQFVWYLTRQGYEAYGVDSVDDFKYKELVKEGTFFECNGAQIGDVFESKLFDLILTNKVFSHAAMQALFLTEYREAAKYMSSSALAQLAYNNAMAVLEASYKHIKPGGFFLATEWEENGEKLIFGPEDAKSIGYVVKEFEPSFALLQRP